MAFNIEDLTNPISSQVQPGFNNLGQIQQNYTTPDFMIYRFISVLMWVFAVAAVIIIIYGGIQYMTAGGDPEKAQSAKKTIIGTIIGIVIFSCSFIIYRTMIKTLAGTPVENIRTESANEGIQNDVKTDPAAEN